MKFDLTDLTGFSDIGTIVYYKSRPFYPETTEVSSEIELMGEGSFLYSTSMTSEYTDFAKTGFLFPQGTQDYPRKLIPNLFDYEDTVEKAGIESYDEVVSFAFPRKTNDKKVPEISINKPP